MASLLGSRQLSETNWPTAAFDVASLRDEGWAEYPFRQFVLKIHSRCNLSCTYCYVYEMADQSWRDKPRIISLNTLKQVALRIAGHATVHQLPVVELVLHGGEPLLCGESFIRAAVAMLRKSVPAETGLSVRLQTNGTLLTQRMLAMLHEHDIKVGVSVDGTAQTHDARRRYANGRGSYHLVSAALRRLATEQYSTIYSGILCTVAVSADPIETYESLAEWAPPSGFSSPTCELVSTTAESARNSLRRVAIGSLRSMVRSAHAGDSGKAVRRDHSFAAWRTQFERNDRP